MSPAVPGFGAGSGRGPVERSGCDRRCDRRATAIKATHVSAGASSGSGGRRCRLAEFNKLQVAELRGFDLSLKRQPVFRHRVMTYDLLAGEAVPIIKSVAGVILPVVDDRRLAGSRDFGRWTDL